MPGETAGPATGRPGEWPAPVLAGVAAAAVVVLAGLTLLVRHDAVVGWEPDVVDAAVDLPAAFGDPLWLVMQLGRRSLVPLMALAVLLGTRRPGVALGVVVAGMATGFGIDAWKAWAARDRPTGVPTREDAHGHGFPSGHTATAFALATIVASLVPGRWRAVPFGLAALVGVGRVHAGVHFPLDVVGGALWGVAVGAATVAALRATGEHR